MSPILLRVMQMVFAILIQAGLLFGTAGSLRWQAGWWYVGLYLLMLGVATFILLPNRKAVVEERSKGAKGGKRWDYWLTRAMMISSFGVLVVAGLDQRLGWTSPLPGWLRTLGGCLFLAGYAFVVWAMYTNEFFSQTVRIQTERGHVAVTDGPYRIVRHPGYLGMSTSMLGSVFLLDALYGLACLAPYLVLIVIRTALEDRTLQAELPGYAEYAAHTKFRLIPGM